MDSLKIGLLSLFNLLMVVSGSQVLGDELIKIVCVGDSIVSGRSFSGSVPKRGWGQSLGEFFDNGVVVRNHGWGGRSSKSYIEEGHWDAAKAENGDYYFIEFGHNDNKKDNRLTFPETTFRNYLREYISDARELGGIPVLVTPFVRREFNDDGTILHRHEAYANAMREVAIEDEVILIDMFQYSEDYFVYIGLAESSHYQVETDVTHFNWMGALWMGRSISSHILWSQHPDLEPLKEHVKDEMVNHLILVPPSSQVWIEMSGDGSNWKSFGIPFEHKGGFIRLPTWIEHGDRLFGRIVYGNGQ